LPVFLFSPILSLFAVFLLSSLFTVSSSLLPSSLVAQPFQPVPCFFSLFCSLFSTRQPEPYLTLPFIPNLQLFITDIYHRYFLLMQINTTNPVPKNTISQAGASQVEFSHCYIKIKLSHGKACHRLTGFDIRKLF
jgi:hypothetical protein